MLVCVRSLQVEALVAAAVQVRATLDPAFPARHRELERVLHPYVLGTFDEEVRRWELKPPASQQMTRPPSVPLQYTLMRCSSIVAHWRPRQVLFT